MGETRIKAVIHTVCDQCGNNIVMNIDINNESKDISQKQGEVKDDKV